MVHTIPDPDSVPPTEAYHLTELAASEGADDLPSDGKNLDDSWDAWPNTSYPWV